MPIRTVKPTSPGRRFQALQTTEDITVSKPLKALTEPLHKSGGRNNTGELTSWWRGGGHKRAYRIIDFKRDKHGIPARITTIEYDPTRSARIALLAYADGERRYILQPDVGLLPVRALAREAALALDLAVDRCGAHVGHLGAKQGLDGLLDLDLGGVDGDLEHDRLAVLFLQDRRLLGHQGTADDIGESHRRASCRRSSAALVAMTVLASITLRAETRLAAT